MMRRRGGMALAVTIGVVSLIAILAVATLSLAGRLVQTSTMGLRDARLDGGTAFGLAAATEQWRSRQLGQLAVGASVSFDAKPAGVPITVSVTVTRIATEFFWVIAEATAEGGAMRRENLIVRARAPDATALLAEDSTNVTTLGFVIIDSLAAVADSAVSGGATLSPTDGVVYVDGDLTLAGGSATGILIVSGRLTIIGTLSYEGVIVARDGISVVVPGVTLTGIIRADGDPPVAGNLSFVPNGVVAQELLRQSLTPRPVAGRRWAEIH